LAVGMLRRIPPASALLVALVVGTVIGFAARIPFRAWIANTGAGYAQPSLWRSSLGYYSELVAARLATPGGVVAALLIGGLLALCVVRTVRCTGGARLITAAGWLIPLLVVVGGIALGTHAARYLQPLVFAPLLGVVATPRAVPMRVGVRRALLAAGGSALLIVTSVSVPRLVHATGVEDRDLACVTSWVDASGRTGAGQFWTVRLPKLHLDEPARLVQVDHTLRGYAWLVNRADFAVGSVTFLVEDAQSQAWELPPGAAPDAVVPCGRYSIVDFGTHPLPLGPQRS
ncbi:MAG: hypothetical protein WA971_08655, partial [Microbacterium sp.]